MINISLKNSSMKRYRALITFLIIGLFPINLPLHTSARENAANIWYFGDDAGLDFNTGITPTVLTDSVSLHSGGSAVISDQEGNLLFYTDGTQVWNAQHETMPNGRDLMGGSFADQPAIIVPNPGNPTLYYVFTVSARFGLYYSTVNLTLHEGLGDVTEKNICLWSAAAGKITAVTHNNAPDIWVIVPSAKDNAFHAYLVTASGVSHTPAVSQAGIGHSRCEFDLSGYVKASPDGKKLALSVFDPGFFELFNFDAATGRVSRSRFLGDYEAAFGIEFSPDSSKLYATVVSWVHKEIYQFDLEATVIPHSVQVIGESSQETRFRALQVGPDGRIYVARENTRYVGVINYPNRLGSASDYVDEGVYLEGRVCRHDFPNFVQSVFQPPVITLSIHDTVANEADRAATFTVSVSEAGRSAVLVDYVTHEGTATAGSDYMTTFGTVTIPEGAIEGSIMIFIIDDDVTADESANTLTFTVRFSEKSQLPVIFSYATHDGTASGDSDYVPASGTMAIVPDSLSGTIVVPIIDDAAAEGEEAFSIELRNLHNATLADNQGVGTIADDER